MHMKNQKKTQENDKDQQPQEEVEQESQFSPETSEVDQLEQDLQQAREEVQRNLEGWKRAQADYQNLKKVSQEEKQEMVKMANAKLLEELIPIFDNFRLAVTQVPEDLVDNAWTQGVGYIYKQLLEALQEEGMEVIDPKGEEFNPYEHEAVEREEGGEEENKITEVIQVGYKLNDKVIRTARVKVAS